MGALQMVLLLAGIGYVIATDPIEISGQLGSSLHLPVADACQFNGSYSFDISTSTQKQIGTYDGHLQPFGRYKGRLTYNTETCTITIMDLTEQDGTSFTVNLMKDINSTIKSHYIYYRVNIIDPLTSLYIVETTQSPAELTMNNTSQILGFVSFCLSLDSPVNALFPIALWVMQKYCNELDKAIGDSTSRISSMFTMVFQIVTIICTMFSGNHYSLFLSLIPILLLVDILKSFGCRPKCVLDALQCIFSSLGDDVKAKKIVLYAWRGVLLLIQMLFAIVVGILYNKFDEILTQESRIGFIFLLPSSILISIALKCGVFSSVYCYKTKTRSLVPTEEAKDKPGDPKHIHV